MKIVRNVQDLEARFRDQVALLQLACENFDEGKEIAALNIATSIRVLVHDTPSSTSALTHKKSKHIDFLDSSLPKTNPNITFTGLTYYYMSNVHDGIGGIAIYRPEFTSSRPNIERWINFDQWWSQIVFQNKDGSSLSRSTLVLKAANQEGGAHIDNSIDSQYDQFRHHYSGGVIIKGTKSGVTRTFDNIPVLPALRQIGFEILESLKKAKL
ncbi:MAG TPA: hypothetical protein VIM89_13615 [Mucilaginibacter sp.]